jgi:hypothetical protein
MAAYYEGQGAFFPPLVLFLRGWNHSFQKRVTKLTPP